MRLAVLSDIHGNYAALQAVVHDLTRRGVGAVVNLGDSVSGPLLPRETAQFLMAQNWQHLAGNHERYLLRAHSEGQTAKLGASDAYAYAQLPAAAFDWMATLAHSRAYAAAGQAEDDIWLCHGTPTKDDAYLLDTVSEHGAHLATAVDVRTRLSTVDHALVLCGHSHMPRVVRTAQGQCIVNPGSVGLPAYAHDFPHVHSMENGSPDARYAIVERVAGHWHCALLAVPYDYAPMATLALQRGRPEWAQALSTGYVTP